MPVGLLRWSPSTITMMEQGVQGVQGVRRLLGYSKKDLLLFSRLHVMGLERQLSEANDAALVADCEFLAEAKFIAAAPESIKDLGLFTLERVRDNLLEELEAEYEAKDFDA